MNLLCKIILFQSLEWVIAENEIDLKAPILEKNLISPYLTKANRDLTLS